MKRITAAKNGFQTPGDFLTRVANMCVSFLWYKNTLSYLEWVGKAPNYVQPRAWSEKLQWRKIFDHNPLFSVFADKLAAQRHAGERIPGLLFPQLFWNGTDEQLVPFDSFETPYVIKPNSGSGDVIIVPDPAKANREHIRERCRKWMDRKSYGRRLGEWGYKKVRQSILVEELLSEQGSTQGIPNFKFFVVSGRVRFIQVESKRGDQSFLTFYDREGVRWPVRKWIGRLNRERMPGPDAEVTLPGNFDEMIRVAEELGKEVDHVRVDLYSVNGNIYFSELTPYDGSGYSYLYEEGEQYEERPSHRLDLELGETWKQPVVSWKKKLYAVLLG